MEALRDVHRLPPAVARTCQASQYLMVALVASALLLGLGMAVRALRRRLAMSATALPVLLWRAEVSPDPAIFQMMAQMGAAPQRLSQTEAAALSFPAAVDLVDPALALPVERGRSAAHLDSAGLCGRETAFLVLCRRLPNSAMALLALQRPMRVAAPQRLSQTEAAALSFPAAVDLVDPALALPVERGRSAARLDSAG
jgi:hypothetical protein